MSCFVVSLAQVSTLTNKITGSIRDIILDIHRLSFHISHSTSWSLVYVGNYWRNTNTIIKVLHTRTSTNGVTLSVECTTGHMSPWYNNSHVIILTHNVNNCLSSVSSQFTVPK